MEKLPMCRVCLAENVRMYIVENKNLRELYETLTDNPFVTEDSRPILTCYFCCTKLKQCYQFQRKCLEAEELFAQMMNEDYESLPLLNQGQPEFCNGFIQTPILHISIVGECKTESVAIKEGLPAVCERLDDIIEPKEGDQSNELELENMENSFLDVEVIPAQHSESYSEYDEPLTEFKIEVEEHEVSRIKPKLLDVITETQKKNLDSDTKVIQATENCMFKTVTKFKETLTDTKRGVDNFSLDTNCHNKIKIKCEKSNIVCRFINRHQILCVKENFKCDICQCCFSEKSSLTSHIHTHSGEKPYKCEVCQRCFTKQDHLTTHIRVHTRKKPYKCDVCQRCFSEKSKLTSHIRTHTGEKPYKYEVCQRCFTEKGNGIKHIRIHTGEKPFKCDVCHRSFNKKGNLTKHADEKHFKCDVCQCCFSQKSNLTRHIRTHTAEKPYKCEVCHRSFSDKSNLKRHVNIHTYKSLFTGNNRKHTSDKLRLLYRMAHLQRSKNIF